MQLDLMRLVAYFFAHLLSFLAHFDCSLFAPHFLPHAAIAGIAASADDARAMAKRALRCFMRRSFWFEVLDISINITKFVVTFLFT